MKKNRTRRTKRQQALESLPEVVTVQLPLPMLGVLNDVRQGFHSLCIESGRQVLSAMMEHDRTALCGPKWIPNAERQAMRMGHTKSLVVLGGRQIEIRRPRARSVDGREQELPSYQWAAGSDPLDAYTMEAIAAGVSTRSYQRTLDPLPREEREVAVSRSAVSRRFVALSAVVVGEYLSRPLGELDLKVIMIDGIVFEDHAILIAVGITSGAEKVPLGVREGTTENAAVATALLQELIARGLPADKAVLFVIDGGKGLRSAITKTFGKLGLVHRCQVHKLRNVLDHLPDHLKAGTRRAMLDAYNGSDAALAKKQLERLATSLEREHPGAAASLREGLDETLILMGLGVSGWLYRSLRSTNIIENVNGGVGKFARNVRRWRDGAMIVRWVASALKEAENKFRRLKGCKEMFTLIAALEKHQPELPVDTKKKAA
jgi:transposase-like protein